MPGPISKQFPQSYVGEKCVEESGFLFEVGLIDINKESVYFVKYFFIHYMSLFFKIFIYSSLHHIYMFSYICRINQNLDEFKNSKD